MKRTKYNNKNYPLTFVSLDIYVCFLQTMIVRNIKNSGNLEIFRRIVIISLMISDLEDRLADVAISNFERSPKRSLFQY